MEDIKEKNADELFLKMGYDKKENASCIKYRNEELDCIIEFDKTRELVCIGNEDDYVSACTMQELQAINKKCKELGWI